MPDKNSSCPRCGFQDMRDISFWKNENHICAECGSYWKTISEDRGHISMDNVVSSDEGNSGSFFGKRKQSKSDVLDHETIDADNKPSAVSQDFFIKNSSAKNGNNHDEDIRYNHNSERKNPLFKKQSFLDMGFVNVATFAVVAVTMVSLPQIGLFSTAGQTIKEQIAYFKSEKEEPTLVDPIVTASISKKTAIAKEFRVGEVNFTRIAKGAQSHIVVHGMIRNISGSDARTKPLRIIMLDKDGNEVQTWVYLVRDKMLEPGKVMRFRSTVKAAGFKAKTVDVVVLN